jgi:hypothetical protein
LTQVRNWSSGMSCSVLQATVQAWHPMHVRWSIAKPYCTVHALPWSSGPSTILGQVRVRR